MSAKTLLVLCAQALLVQTVFSQCLGYTDRIAIPYGLAGAGLAYDGLAYNGLGVEGLILAGNGLPYSGIVDGYNAAYGISGIDSALGIALPISSASPITPSGISLASANAIEGTLAVSGDLPFVSAVALDAAVPTNGAGYVAYSAGNGNIGISQYLDRGIGFTAPYGLTGTSLAIEELTYNGLTGSGLGLPGNGLAYSGTVDGAYNAAYGVAGIADAPSFAPASGGPLLISCSSPIAPTGITVQSENTIEGFLAVFGDLPFTSAVALEAAVPSTGAGSVTYSGGNGNIGIESNNGYSVSVADGLTYGNGLAYGNGLVYGNGVTSSAAVADGLACGNLLAYGNGLTSSAAVADGLAYGNDLVYGNGLAYGNCLAAAATVSDRLAYGPGLAAVRSFGGIAAPALGGCGCGAV